MTPATGETVLVELPLVLPQVGSEKDQCVDRLLDRVKAKRGILKAHVKRANGDWYFCLHYDPRELSLAEVRRLVEREGAAISSRYRHESLHITDMDCADCALSIEHILRRVEGLLTVSVSYPAERLYVEYDSHLLSLEEIVRRVRQLGYTVELPRREPRGWIRRHAELARAMVSGASLALAFLLDEVLHLPREALGLYLVSYFAGGWDATKHGLLALAYLRLEVDLLMVAAAAGAAVLGHYPEGALLLLLFSLGHSLEKFVLVRARREIETLSRLRPERARVRRNGEFLELPVEELLRGDVVIVRPGERIPVDGKVVSGASEVDQSPITGESVPVAKGAGDPVLQGSLNGPGTLEIEVDRLAGDTTLSRMLRLIEQAESRKPRVQLVLERFQRVYVPLALALVFCVAVLPPLLGWLPWKTAALRGIAVLVALSPCALVVAAPATTLSALARGAREGILVKGGTILQSLGVLRAIAFDKTGTLTRGRPEVVEVVGTPGIAAGRVLEVAASAAMGVPHPLSEAIVRKAQSSGIRTGPPREVRARPGMGLVATVDGRRIAVGNRRLLEELGCPLPAEIIRMEEGMRTRGITVSWVAVDTDCVGLIGFRDSPRPEARSVLAQLRALGIERVAVVSGDAYPTVHAIAQELGIDDVRAELLPEGKVEAVEDLVRAFRTVAMVGDGVNDAPAMARATVGIAMGASGSEMALDTADVALMSDELTHLPSAIALGRASRRILLQNLGLSLIVIAILVPLAITGLAGIPLAIILHEGTTLIVGLNALRLLVSRSPKSNLMDSRDPS